VEERFEVAEKIHALAEGIAEESDAFALFELDRRRGIGRAERNCGEKEQS
jgi:hypothetical protein